MTPESPPPPADVQAPAADPATPDPFAAGAAVSVSGSLELSAHIRAEIEGSPDRRISFARYMKLALLPDAPRPVSSRRQS